MERSIRTHSQVWKTRVLYNGGSYWAIGASRYQPQASGGNRGQEFMDPFTGE